MVCADADQVCQSVIKLRATYQLKPLVVPLKIAAFVKNWLYQKTGVHSFTKLVKLIWKMLKDA